MTKPLAPTSKGRLPCRRQCPDLAELTNDEGCIAVCDTAGERIIDCAASVVPNARSMTAAMDEAHAASTVKLQPTRLKTFAIRPEITLGRLTGERVLGNGGELLQKSVSELLHQGISGLRVQVESIELASRQATARGAVRRVAYRSVVPPPMLFPITIPTFLP